MKKIIIALIVLFVSLQAYSATDIISTANEILDNSDTCLEMKYDLDNGSTLIEYIYINNENKKVVFANGISAEVLEYNNNIIKFKITENDPNNKGYIIETFYEINRYTGGCTIEKYKKAVGARQRFDNALFGMTQTYLYKSGAGTVKKIDSNKQKF